MKKLFLLVSCAAALLVLSNMSFAAEEAVADAVPCACSNCDCAAMPFAYPPQGLFGGKFASLGSKCSLGHRVPQAFPFPAALPCPEVLPEPCAAYPYPYPPSKAYLRAVRRVAKLTPPPCPPLPVPALMPAPPVVGPPLLGPPPAAFVAPGAPAFAATTWQAGYKNSVSQRAPVVNFLSIVRAPRSPFEPYPGYVAPVCPCQETE